MCADFDILRSIYMASSILVSFHISLVTGSISPSSLEKDYVHGNGLDIHGLNVLF
jgi:hypothetical protein